MSKKLYEESSIRDIANAIREKNESTTTYKVAEMGAAVRNLPTGSSSPESDPREVYGGTRPAEWLRLPDYDKVANRTMYCLVKLFPYGTNKVSFGFRFDGTCTMSAGKVINGGFVAFENDEPVTETSASPNIDVVVTRVFNYADYADTMSDGTKQIVVKFEISNHWHRVWSKANYSNRYYVNDGVVDIILRKDDEQTGTFETEGYLTGCRYFYNFGNKIPANLNAIEYVKTQSGICEPNERLYLAMLKSFWGTVKLTKWTETFRQCTNLKELICDISETTSWNNPFYSSAPCYSLRKLLFVGGENLTSFPGDINLSSTALEGDAILAFFNTLPNISASETPRTITLKSTPAALDGIPADTLAIATNKGWTVVTA